MKKPAYIPPYVVSGKAMGLIADIAAAVERLRIVLEGPDGVRLRRIGHVRTLRGTTAIEGNTLSEEQITALLDGKRVVGDRREIAEIEGAHRAYGRIAEFNPHSLRDLLKAHALMMGGLVERPGRFRTGGVGVVDSRGRVLHMAPPAHRVPDLVRNLFAWLAASPDPVLVTSCVFHCEFEFIHPFSDGNGRMGRLWQTALLGAWRPEMLAVPVENIVWAHQAGYYDAFRASGGPEGCGPFIDFMLDKILLAVRAAGEGAASKSRDKSREKSREKILRLLKDDPFLTQAGLAAALGLSVKAIEKNIRQLKDANRLRRIGPDNGGHWEVVG